MVRWWREEMMIKHYIHSHPEETYSAKEIAKELPRFTIREVGQHLRILGMQPFKKTRRSHLWKNPYYIEKPEGQI
jgi:hypothetical protein